MEGNALERLFKDNSQNNTDYTLEEQMASAEENEDFLDNMSNESKNALINKLTEITLDDSDDEIDINLEATSNTKPDIKVINSNEETSNKDTTSEVIPKRRGRKKKEDAIVNEVDYQENTLFTPIMDQLAKDLLDELISSDFKIARFNKEQMQIIYNYMYNKF